MRYPVMVPLDGSPFAEQALPWALAVARRMGAPLQLTHVRPSWPLDAEGHEGTTYLHRMQAQLLAEAPAGVDICELNDDYAPLDYPPPAPDAVAGLLGRYAASAHAALIVMATHGHGGVRRAWLGSVADSLVRRAPCPVLLVRPTDEAFTSAAAADRGLGHLLVPVDGTEASRRALWHALELGSLFDARYTLLRVMSPLAWEVSPHSYDPYPVALSPMSGQAAAADLDAMAAPLRERGLRVSTAVIDATAPGPAILEYAAAHGVDAIVIATGGSGPVRRLLLGSVSDKVVRGSTAPVLICNTRRIEPRLRTVEVGEGTQQSEAVSATK
jgi:nucleotide-binding universal stress UspA family protein